MFRSHWHSKITAQSIPAHSSSALLYRNSAPFSNAASVVDYHAKTTIFASSGTRHHFNFFITCLIGIHSTDYSVPIVLFLS